MILTYVPSTENNRSTAEHLAAGLGMPLVAPPGVGLTTFDDSHLDPGERRQLHDCLLRRGRGPDPRLPGRDLPG